MHVRTSSPVHTRFRARLVLYLCTKICKRKKRGASNSGRTQDCTWISLDMRLCIRILTNKLYILTVISVRIYALSDLNLCACPCTCLLVGIRMLTYIYKHRKRHTHTYMCAYVFVYAGICMFTHTCNMRITYIHT